MIQLKNVSKFYYSKGMISSGISGVSLELDKGEFVVITGESGSGKTTLLNVISGLDTYEEGEMYIDGKETSHYLASDFEEYRKKYIGNIFQNFNLINSYTVYQNIELILRINGYRRADMKRRISDILERVGLKEYAKTKVSKLSGGQKQRVAIARALAKDTDIIVADEPTGNLDSESAHSIATLLSDIAKDKLVIIVTHSYEQFEQYATRKIKMHDGKLVEDRIVNRKAEVSQDVADAPEISDSISAIAKTPAGYISPGSVLRLGFRNTFNIFYKFLLLLLVFIFVMTAVTAQYTTFKKQEEEAEKRGYNEFFYNYSEDRMVLKKKDGSRFGDNDFKAIDNVYNIKSVVPEDIMLDNGLYLEGNNMSYEVFPVGINKFKGKLDAGRMPAGDNEVIFSAVKDEYLFSEDMVSDILNKEFSIYMGENNEINVRIVGIAFKSESESENIYSPGEMFISDALMSEMMKERYHNESVISIDINGNIQLYEGYGSYYRLIVNSNVDKGEVLMSQEVNNFYDNLNAKGKTVKVSVENIFYSRTAALEISDTYTEKNFEEKTGLKDYSAYMGSVFVNREDYSRLFAGGNYQVSVYVNDVREMAKTKDALETMGYEVHPLKNFLVSYNESNIASIIQVPVVIMVLAALFFISYFVVSLILRSRSEYFSILRMLGLPRVKIRRILDVELLTVVSIAFCIFMAFMVLIYGQVIKVEYMWSLALYMDAADYALLYLVLMLMAYMISGKFARRIFRKSAMGSFREEA